MWRGSVRSAPRRFSSGSGVDGEVFVTERCGHARELALAALGRGASRCVAWGGDGTINEVASALAFTPASIGDHSERIRQRAVARARHSVRSASGVRHRARRSRTGDRCGRDRGPAVLQSRRRRPRCAHRASVRGDRTRAPRLRRYLEIASTEIFRRSQHDLVVATDGRVATHRARCSSRSPTAGSTATARSSHPTRASTTGSSTWCRRRSFAVGGARHAPKLFRGRLADVPGVTMSVRDARRDHLERAADLPRGR